MSVVAICRCLPPVSPSPLLSLGDSEKCSSTYTGGTGRTLKARATEHRCPSCSISEVFKHLHLQERLPHQGSMGTIKYWTGIQWITEGEHIWLHQPYLNKDGSKHQVPHDWASCWPIYVDCVTWNSKLYVMKTK